MIFDPEEELKKLRKRMEELTRPFEKFVMPEFREPLTDIEESEDEIIITLEMPGIEKKDIQLEVTPESIKVKAERKEAKEIMKKGFYKSERAYKGFYRELSLPARVDAEKASAEYKEGVLKITLPKLEKKKTKRISIK